MQDWSFNFGGNSHRKTCQIHVNGDFDHGKVLHVETEWTIYEFLNAASKRLSMVPAATRVFNADGVEVDDVMMIVDDDILFLSMHDDYIPPKPLITAAEDAIAGGSGTSGDQSDHLPSLIGGYKVGALLGKGGFGEVRVGEHSLTGEKVALKFLKKSEIHSLGAAERTNTEIQCLFALKHANIIRLQQHLESPHHVILVFELMEGGDLLQYLAKTAIRRQEAFELEQKRQQVKAELRRDGSNVADDEDEPDEQSNVVGELPTPIDALSHSTHTARSQRVSSGRRTGLEHAESNTVSAPRATGNGLENINTSTSSSSSSKAALSKFALTENEAKYVFYQVLSAVSYAHNQHICHRDLKLENILLKDTTLATVKIADFGLSDFYRPGALVKSSCGTLSFLAPEVFKGTANAGPPLDVWSLGVILFALLCGRLPFEGPSLVGGKRPRDAVIKSRILKGQYKIDEALGLEAKDLLRRMLDADPGERATIPEIFNHVWLRSQGNNPFIDIQISHGKTYDNINSVTSTTSSSSLVRKSSSYNNLQSIDVDSSLSPSQRLNKLQTNQSIHKQRHRKNPVIADHDQSHGPGSCLVAAEGGSQHLLQDADHLFPDLLGETDVATSDLVVDAENRRILKCNSPTDSSLLSDQNDTSNHHALPPIVPAHNHFSHNIHGNAQRSPHNHKNHAQHHVNQHLLHEHAHVHHFAAIDEEAEVDTPSPMMSRLSPSLAPMPTSKSRHLATASPSNVLPGTGDPEMLSLGDSDYHGNSSHSINSSYTPTVDHQQSRMFVFPISPNRARSTSSPTPRMPYFSQPQSRSNSGTYMISLSRECSKDNLSSLADDSSSATGHHNSQTMNSESCPTNHTDDQNKTSSGGDSQQTSHAVVTNQFRLVPLRRQNSKGCDSPDDTPRKSIVSSDNESVHKPGPTRGGRFSSPMVSARRIGRSQITDRTSDDDDDGSIGNDSNNESVTSSTHRRGRTHGSLASSKRNRASVYNNGFSYVSGSPNFSSKDSSSRRDSNSVRGKKGNVPHYASPVGHHRERGRRGNDDNAGQSSDSKEHRDIKDNSLESSSYNHRNEKKYSKNDGGGSRFRGIGALDLALTSRTGIAAESISPTSPKHSSQVDGFGASVANRTLPNLETTNRTMTANKNLSQTSDYSRLGGIGGSTQSHHSSTLASSALRSYY